MNPKKPTVINSATQCHCSVPMFSLERQGNDGSTETMQTHSLWYPFPLNSAIRKGILNVFPKTVSAEILIFDVVSFHRVAVLDSIEKLVQMFLKPTVNVSIWLQSIKNSDYSRHLQVTASVSCNGLFRVVVSQRLQARMTIVQFFWISGECSDQNLTDIHLALLTHLMPLDENRYCYTQSTAGKPLLRALRSGTVPLDAPLINVSSSLPNINATLFRCTLTFKAVSRNVNSFGRLHDSDAHNTEVITRSFDKQLCRGF